MENASKALIIAGAILVSILLISIGVMVIQSTGNVQQGMAETMDSSAIQQFNGKFDPYIGNKQSASNAKGLLSAVIANNANSSHKLKVYTDGACGEGTSTKTIAQGSATETASDIAGLSAVLLNKKTYTVTITDSNSDGYYDLIKIKQQ